MFGKIKETKTKQYYKSAAFWIIFVVVICFTWGFNKGLFVRESEPREIESKVASENSIHIQDASVTPASVLDFAAYDKKLWEIANVPSTTPTSTRPGSWPAKVVYPNSGALLPFNRIVAYYGNLYSKGMGVLGEYPED